MAALCFVRRCRCHVSLWSICLVVYVYCLLLWTKRIVNWYVWDLGCQLCQHFVHLATWRLRAPRWASCYVMMLTLCVGDLPPLAAWRFPLYDVMDPGLRPWAQPAWWNLVGVSCCETITRVVNSHTWFVVSFKGVLWLLQSCRGQSLPVFQPVAAAAFSRGLLL